MSGPGIKLSDHRSDFDTLLQNNDNTCNHHRNNQTLIVEIYKIKNNFNPPRRNNTYNLRMGLETLNYRSPELWSILLENLKYTNADLKICQYFRPCMEIIC